MKVILDGTRSLQQNEVIILSKHIIIYLIKKKRENIEKEK